MKQFLSLLVNISFFLTIVMALGEAKTAINRCQSTPTTAGSCKQECDEDCKMTCAEVKPPLKSCDQECWNGRCDMKCVTKDACYQNCKSAFNSDGSVFCKTANCTQMCDEGTCDLSCRARSRCKQTCNGGSCNLKCPKTGEHCKQVS